MLKVQEYLRSKNKDTALEELQEEFGIKSLCHDDGRVILNYNQIDSYQWKTHPIVVECRGLVLDRFNNWDLVARAFPRFFNLGECPELEEKFDWRTAYSMDKEDGSLILIYHWNNKFHINTRGSFGDGQINDTAMTWRSLVEECLPTNYEKLLDKNLTYVFELCSRYNKVVRDYPLPCMYLLSMFFNSSELIYNDLAFSYYRYLFRGSVKLNVQYKFNNASDVEKYLSSVSETTFEGVVLRDNNNNRIKIKKSDYLKLHRIASNGNLTHVKNIIPIIMAGEIDEIVSYFPEMESRFRKIESVLNKWFKELESIWFVWGDEPSRKKFAKEALKHPLSSVLFQLKDADGKKSLNKVWRESEELLIKKISQEKL